MCTKMYICTDTIVYTCACLHLCACTHGEEERTRERAIKMDAHLCARARVSMCGDWHHAPWHQVAVAQLSDRRSNNHKVRQFQLSDPCSLLAWCGWPIHMPVGMCDALALRSRPIPIIEMLRPYSLGLCGPIGQMQCYVRRRSRHIYTYIYIYIHTFGYLQI